MSDFVPRIAVRDADDEALIAACLLNYIRHSLGHVMMGERNAIPKFTRAAALLDALYQGAADKIIQEQVPTDDEIRETLEKFTQDFGDDG